MIVKSLSRKSGVGTLIKYVFRESARSIPQKHVEQVAPPQGVQLSKLDWKYLYASMRDALLLKDFHDKMGKDGSIKEYVEQHLLPKEVPFMLTHNLRSKTIEGYVKEFERNDASRLFKRSNTNVAVHDIISFHRLDRDKIDEQVLKDITQKYIELRAPNSLAVCTGHYDKDHLHIHVVHSGAQVNGRSSRVSKAQFEQIKKELEAYQREKYPQLINSVVHDKTKQKEAQKKIKTAERFTDKEKLVQVLETSFAKAGSREQFISKLAEQGYQAYYRAGRFQGVVSENEIKFRINRLGYTEEKMQLLDQRKEQEKGELQQLSALRGGNTKVQDRLQRLQDQELSKTDTEKSMEVVDRQGDEREVTDENNETLIAEPETVDDDNTTDSDEADFNDLNTET